MALISIEQYTDSQQRAARRVLNALTRVESRLQQRMFREKRQNERLPYHSVAVLKFSEPAAESVAEAAACCRVWTCTLSRTGLSFICPGRLPQSQFAVGLSLPEADIVWLQAEVARTREFPDEGFWEYGVRFQSRIEPELAGPPPADVKSQA